MPQETKKKTEVQFTTTREELPIKRLKWEDFKVGDELQTTQKFITLRTCYLAMENVSGMGQDLYSGHTDPKSSQQQFGVKTMPVSGKATTAGVTPMILKWLGDPAPWVSGGESDLKLIQLVTPGDRLTYHGKVVDKKVEGKKKNAFLEVYAENARGEKVMVGTAKVVFQ
jgi:acyl dehydratase